MGESKLINKRNGRTELDVPHEKEIVSFVFQKFSAGSYSKVREMIKAEGLCEPTMAEIVSLVHAAYKYRNKYCDEIIHSMKKIVGGTLLAFTGSLCVSNGYYIQDNPKITDGELFMDESELEEKLKIGDPSVRFVSGCFKTYNFDPCELKYNKYIVGWMGEKSAGKLAEVADKAWGGAHLWVSSGLSSLDFGFTLIGRFLGIHSNTPAFAGGFSYGISRRDGGEISRILQ